MKRCVGCNMPPTSGTLWVCDEGLKCGACLRDEVRLWKSSSNEHAREVQRLDHALADARLELERLRGIVRDLAAVAPVVMDYDGHEGRNYCALCTSDGGRPIVHHVEECPHHRAVEWAKENPR